MGIQRFTNFSSNKDYGENTAIFGVSYGDDNPDLHQDLTENDEERIEPAPEDLPEVTVTKSSMSGVTYHWGPPGGWACLSGVCTGFRTTK